VPVRISLLPVGTMLYGRAARPGRGRPCLRFV